MPEHPKFWRFTTKTPRHALAILLYAVAAMFIITAVQSNNPAAVVVALIPVPLLLLLATAELHRALEEEGHR